MNKTTDLVADICRELRAVIRLRVLHRPQEAMAVSIECENNTLRIMIPRREFDHSELLKLLSNIDDDLLSVEKHLENADGSETVCTVDDVKELKFAIDQYYEIYHTELYPVDEIKCYVEAHWDIPEWRVETAFEESGEKSMNEVRQRDNIDIPPRSHGIWYNMRTWRHYY